MSFSAEWLALREPVDHRARNAELLAQLSEKMASKSSIDIVDLGCGAGSNLRAVAPHLGSRQRWRLIDYDRDLLATAKERLAAWGDEAQVENDSLHIRKNNRDITVTFAQVDLSRDLEKALGEKPDLVTAAALFDLVSASWLDRFVVAVKARHAFFYTALTYDGEETWHPPHSADEAVLAAFHAHQRGDKGFGPSVGPGATEALKKAFLTDYSVAVAPSPWRLGASDSPLVEALAQGAAQAVGETGLVSDKNLADWRKARLKGATCVIGHLDLLAFPR